MTQWMLLPPVAFLVVLLLMSLNMMGLGFYTAPKKPNAGKGKPYACGHDVDHRVRPDYTKFFHFAFFFTIMHVVTLIVATVPSDSMKALGIAVAYIATAVVGLFVTFRRW